MAADYIHLLTKLTVSLNTAICNQEYHRLMELDSAVRACVAEAMTACEHDEKLKADVALKIRALMTAYKQVTQICSEQSESLKKELQQLRQSKNGASQYLQVAGKFG